MISAIGRYQKQKNDGAEGTLMSAPEKGRLSCAEFISPYRRDYRQHDYMPRWTPFMTRAFPCTYAMSLCRHRLPISQRHVDSAKLIRSIEIRRAPQQYWNLLSFTMSITYYCFASPPKLAGERHDYFGSRLLHCIPQIRMPTIARKMIMPAEMPTPLKLNILIA